MNLIDLQDKLKNFSEQQLIQEMQMPTGQTPQFLLLSEITRRKKMREAFEQEQGKEQNSTVAQDVVAAAGMPMGFASQMAGNMAPQTDMAGNTGAMPQQSSMPPQRMAEGGIVALQEGGRIDSRSGLERMEQEQETAMLTSTSPTIRALRLSEIGGNIGDFVNEVGLNAIRQADALVAAGGSLGTRTAAGGTAALGALASVLGFPNTGAMFERTANNLAQKRSEMMGRSDGERMPFGLTAGRVFTSPEQTPFTVPQETRNMYTQAEVLRRLGNTPDDSPLFAEGLPNERLSQQYDLLPGSTGPSPIDAMGTDFSKRGIAEGVGWYRDPLSTSPGYFSAPDVALTGRPSQLPTFDVSTGVPLSVEDVASAAFPTQADLDMRYGAQEGDRFPGEARVESERQAAITPPVDAARDLDAFLSGGVESLPTGVDAVTDFGVNLADQGIRSFGNLMERALATGQSKAERGDAPPEVRVPDETTIRPKARPDAAADTGGGDAPSGGGGAGGAGGARGIASVAAQGAPSNFEQELLNMLDAREKRATQDKWLALAQAGMALMSSKDPTFGGALGEAGAVGLGALREGQSGAEADRLALLGQIEQSRMGREKLNLERQALAARSAARSGGGMNLYQTLGRLKDSVGLAEGRLTMLTGGLDADSAIAAAQKAGENRRALDIKNARDNVLGLVDQYQTLMSLGGVGGSGNEPYDASD